MQCAADDCNRESVTRVGYCVMHYKRWKRNGTVDRVIEQYDETSTCIHCGDLAGPFRKGLCNACRTRLMRKGYTDRDINEAGVGSINAGGYRIHTVGGKRVYEHRIQAARKLGRPLLRGEVVHHIDGDVSNNNLENLEILSSQSAHMKLHWSQK